MLGVLLFGAGWFLTVSGQVGQGWASFGSGLGRFIVSGEGAGRHHRVVLSLLVRRNRIDISSLSSLFSVSRIAVEGSLARLRGGKLLVHGCNNTILVPSGVVRRSDNRRVSGQGLSVTATTISLVGSRGHVVVSDNDAATTLVGRLSEQGNLIIVAGSLPMTGTLRRVRGRPALLVANKA